MACNLFLILTRNVGPSHKMQIVYKQINVDKSVILVASPNISFLNLTFPSQVANAN